MSKDRLNRYKVLGAAYSLREFTVADLERYSGVNTASIQRVIASDRDGHFLETLGRELPRGRGSPPLRYRIAPEKAEELRSLLRTIHTVIQQVSQPMMSADTKSASGPSAELLAAEYALLDEYPEAVTSEEKAAILRRARLDRQKDKELSGLPQPATIRGQVVDVLLALAELGTQLELGEDGPPLPDSTRTMTKAIVEAILSALPQPDEEYMQTVLEWLDHGLLSQGVIKLGDPISEKSAKVVFEKDEFMWEDDVAACAAVDSGIDIDLGGVELVIADMEATPALAEDVEKALQASIKDLEKALIIPLNDPMDLLTPQVEVASAAPDEKMPPRPKKN